MKGKWSTVGKMLSSSMACNREAPHEKELTEQQTSMLSYFEKLPQPPLISATSTVIGQQPSKYFLKRKDHCVCVCVRAAGIL